MKHTDLLIKSFEAFPNFVIINQYGRIIYINESYCRLLGLKNNLVVGKPVDQIIPGTKMMEILKTGRTDNGDIMTLYDHEQKKKITVVCTRMPLYEDGEIIGAVAVTLFSNLDKMKTLTDEIVRLKEENLAYESRIRKETEKNDPLLKIIGNSPEIKKVKETIRYYAPSELTILITGETGVGKEVFANAIYELSNRNGKPFVKVNCAAIPHDLLESELFGYEAGAFTGAKAKGKIGLFEAANHGTILLDELGEMPIKLQSKLLRALHEHEIMRVGSTKTIPIDVRVICSTNRNIMEMVKEKKFREDLYYRINTVEIEVPSLRERISDIEVLADFFIRRYNKESGVHTTGISDEVLRLFVSYDWPGNVRELKHIMERLSYKNPDSEISLDDCDFLIHRMQKHHVLKDTEAKFLDQQLDQSPAQAIQQSKSSQSFHQEQLQSAVRSIKEQRAQAEISSIIIALAETGGNKSKAAKLLGIDRSVLYYKLKKYKIRKN